MNKTSPLLQAHSLSGGLDVNNTVITDFSIEVMAGERIAIVGPNGAGKSTILSFLSGLSKPSNGEVILKGRNLNSLTRREIANHLAFLPQSPSAPNQYTVSELVKFGRHPRRGILAPWSTDDQRICDEAMQYTGVSEMSERQIGSLSGGQRQRVWLAMVVAQGTPLLLLDEPTAGLDICHQLEFLELIAKQAERKHQAVLCVIHDLAHARQFFDRIVVLSPEQPAITLSARALDSAVMDTVFNVDAELIRHLRTGTFGLMASLKK